MSKSNLQAVPADYHRKQTVAGGERYITPALKEDEEKGLGADERILERELEIFERLRTPVASESPRIQATAPALATLHVLGALPEAAALDNYLQPHLHDGHLRRPQPRVGGRRVPRHEPEDAPEDAVRHALSRADGPGRRDAGRGELPRLGARVEGRHHLSAQDRPGTIGSQLRHPGRAARGASEDRDRARARDPRRARARRADARRATVGERHAV